MNWNSVKMTLPFLLLVNSSGAFRILYPQHPLYSKQADEPYQPEYVKCLDKGIDCSLFDFDDFVGYGKFRPRPVFKPGETVLYRGWMMTPAKYKMLIGQLQKQEAVPITSFEDYTKCHHLPGWYEECRDLTAETHFVIDPEKDEDVVKEASKLGWEDGFFVKDFVKSNSGDKGSIAKTSSDIVDILDQLKLYRGNIEGGIALRKVEKYEMESERRYFVVNQKAFGPRNGNDDEIPTIVHTVTERVKAPFYSVDVAKRVSNDEWRVVELGDGQVSDKKEWPLDQFVELLARLSG